MIQFFFMIERLVNILICNQGTFLFLMAPWRASAFPFISCLILTASLKLTLVLILISVLYYVQTFRSQKCSVMVVLWQCHGSVMVVSW